MALNSICAPQPCVACKLPFMNVRFHQGTCWSRSRSFPACFRQQAFGNTRLMCNVRSCAPATNPSSLPLLCATSRLQREQRSRRTDLMATFRWRHTAPQCTHRRARHAPGAERWSRLPARALHHHVERVLRYPDGQERRIIYPAPEATWEEEDAEESSYSAWDITGLWSASPARPPLAGAATSQRMPRAKPGNKRIKGVRPKAPWPTGSGADLPPQQLPRPEAATYSSSHQDTVAFLEGLFAASYQSQQAQQQDRGAQAPPQGLEQQPQGEQSVSSVPLAERYEVLKGCPWPLPRSVFVVALDPHTADGELSVGSTHTLRVRVEGQSDMDELAKVLGKHHALHVSALTDGVVAFEDAGDADAYARMLREEGVAKQALVADVDSHKLFRTTGAAKALVVLLRAGLGLPPRPWELAAALKKQKAWDEL